jgi:hypothetical protein
VGYVTNSSTYITVAIGGLMSILEDVANAAKNFFLTYGYATRGYDTHPHTIESDLEILEDALRAYHESTRAPTETPKEG